jgi:predicted transcriptional regulator
MAMTLRLTYDQDKALTALAEAQQISKQEAAVRAIEEQAARLGVAGDVRDWVDHALVRYEALLDRLAQ